LAEQKTISCDRCGAQAHVYRSKTVRNHRGKGVLRVVVCPKCGEHEQWIEAPEKEK
jgi:RNase P subunit RPR2